MSKYPTGNRTVLSYADVYRVARQAGFTASQAVIMAAIAMSESGRQPGVVQSGQPYRTTGWGLWQITPGNSVPSVGTDDQLLDPLTNARAAKAKFDGAARAGRSGFSPWTTYTSGAYRKYVAAAQSAANAVGADLGGVVGGAEGAGAAAAAQAAAGGSAGGLGGPVVTDWQSMFTAINKFIGSGGGVLVNPAPGDVQTIIGGAAPDWLKGVVSVVSGVTSWLSGPVEDLGNLLHALLWLVNPMNWVRIIAGVIGAASVIVGAILVATS